MSAENRNQQKRLERACRQGGGRDTERWQPGVREAGAPRRLSDHCPAAFAASRILRAGTSPAVQWSGLCAFTAEGPGSIPGRGTKILQQAEGLCQGLGTAEVTWRKGALG